MRSKILLLALLSSAAAARAGSIDVVVTDRNVEASVERVRCFSCNKKVEKKQEPVVELTPGTQKIEIREVDGVRKIFRTEAWLGGSPVVFVSKALPEEAPAPAAENVIKSADAATAPEAVTQQAPSSSEAGMIDEKAKTSAVSSEVGAQAKVAPKVRAFDASSLELRLN